MRFLLLIIPGGGYERAGPDAPAPADCIAQMEKFSQDMREAGILLGGEGLHPPSLGARVTFSGGKPTVTDGPFTETKECIGGFWMIQVASRAEAIAWARRCPASVIDAIEVRQVQEIEDLRTE
jgi:hypothetical protein